jgi:ABC-type transporter MlaC component
MKILLTSLFALSLISSSFANAETVRPDVLVRTVVQDVLTTLRHEKDKKRIQSVVDERVLPLFDFTLMTKRAVVTTVGKEEWNHYPDAKKKKLIEQFRQFLVRDYIQRSFSAIGEATIKVNEINGFNESDSDATVRTVINTQGEAAIPVDYDMKKTAAGWKVTDIAIHGARVALSIYKHQFESILRKSSIDGLIQYLEEANQTADAAMAKKAAAR